jgi:hypothetical protein
MRLLASLTSVWDWGDAHRAPRSWNPVHDAIHADATQNTNDRWVSDELLDSFIGGEPNRMPVLAARCADTPKTRDLANASL